MRDVNSLNRVILVGRLGQKPEVRVIPQMDRTIARFSLATNEKVFNPTTKESSDRTEWHRIVVWGKQAEFCERFLDRGRQVLIEGKLRTRSWQDRDGNKRSTTEVEAVNIVLLGRAEGPRPEGPRPAGPVESTSPEASFADPAAPEFPADDLGPGEREPEDDVPF